VFKYHVHVSPDGVKIKFELPEPFRCSKVKTYKLLADAILRDSFALKLFDL